MGYYNQDTDDGGYTKADRIQKRAEQIAGHDGGFCNSRKAKEYRKAEEQARREFV